MTGEKGMLALSEFLDSPETSHLVYPWAYGLDLRPQLGLLPPLTRCWLG